MQQPSMDRVTVRTATPEDAGRLLEIYAYYVENTAVSFECAVPSLEAFQARIRHTLLRYPYLVAEREGCIQGYAYAGPFKDRAAYDWCCELSIYLDPGAQKRGLGRLLYEALEEQLGEMGIVHLYACIAVPPEEDDEYLTWNSARFHAHMGFATVGKFERCAYKFGRWYSMLWMGKTIGERLALQPPVWFRTPQAPGR